MYSMEELPNLYNLVVCLSSLINTSQGGIWNDAQLMKSLYYFKPILEAVALITLIIQLFPLFFGTYVWYYGQTVKERDLGETTLIETVQVLLPFITSLILFYMTTHGMQKGLNMLFAARPSTLV
mmetsp:Transcript_13095/g.22103  ORF Transcript_13095/g.22103 Transcript_13095/m.22103 type:complete len:124 (+) Transcript_13095:199-570(+)